MAKREPKTIEEARVLIKAAMPDGCMLFVDARFYDHPHDGTDYSTREYDCRITHERLAIKIRVEAHKPADLAKKAITALNQAALPRGLAVPNVAPRRSRATKRPPAQQPLLSYQGE